MKCMIPPNLKPMGESGSVNHLKPEPDRTEPQVRGSGSAFFRAEPNVRFVAPQMPEPGGFFHTFLPFLAGFSRFSRFEPRTEPEPNPGVRGFGRTAPRFGFGV